MVGRASPGEVRRISHDPFDSSWGARAGDLHAGPQPTTIRADVKAMFGLMTVHGTFRLQSRQVSIGADPTT